MKSTKINLERILTVASMIFFIFGVVENGFAKAIEWPVSAGGNGHYYMAVLKSGGITWDEANNAATIAGGYLVTITSAAENDFVYNLVSGNDDFWFIDEYGNGEGPFLGGYQLPGSPEPSGGWRWVTEEPFTYTNWAHGEPNNFYGDENKLVFFGPKTPKGPYWNDVCPLCKMRGYIVEFENPPPACFEENDPFISYTGTWYICDSCCPEYPPCGDGTLKYSNETGAKTEFCFNGTGIRWIVAKAKMLGKARVYLDGVYMGMIDLYSSTKQCDVVLQKTGLSSGTHCGIIKVSGQKNPNSTGYYIDIDAFEILP